MLEICDELKSVEQVKEVQIMLYAVSKQEVLNKDTKRLKSNLEILKKAGKYSKGKLFLTFDGFENDEREIYMIPEIRSFVKNIWEEYKYLFYFLTSLDNNRAIIFACINDFKAYKDINSKICNLQIIDDNETKKQTIDTTKQYGETINDLDGAIEILHTFI